MLTCVFQVLKIKLPHTPHTEKEDHTESDYIAINFLLGSSFFSTYEICSCKHQHTWGKILGCKYSLYVLHYFSSYLANVTEREDLLRQKTKLLKKASQHSKQGKLKRTSLQLGTDSKKSILQQATFLQFRNALPQGSNCRFNF